MNKSIFYRFPRLYLWGLRLLHRQAFSQRYRYIASFTRRGDFILEPGCGPAPLTQFLPPKSRYQGFDTNRHFINYGKRQGLDIFSGNALDPKNYRPADIVVACDLLHHLPQNRRRDFIRLAWESSQKMLIICEPGKPNNYRKHHKVWQKIRHWLAEWSERDGQNFVRWNSYYTRRQLLAQIRLGFNIIPPKFARHQETIGEDIVAVFFKDRRTYRQFHYPKTVSAIVPVYNEEKTVAKLVETLLASPLIREVICINDGSTDRSLAILQKFQPRIKLINLRRNHGKGFALAAGIQAASGEIVAFFDADIVNLRQMHIRALLTPLLKSQTRVVLGLRGKSGSLWEPFFQHLGGERAYYRHDLLPLLPKMRRARFGVEMLLNKRFLPQTTKVRLWGLRVLLKYQKHSPTIAIKEYLQEAAEVAWGFGQAYHLVPEDIKIIKRLRRISDIDEFRRVSRHLHSRRLKRLFSRYILHQLEKLNRRF